jgi:hypothetical protein
MHPVPEKAKGKGFTRAVLDAERIERKDRRRQLFKEGKHIAETEIVPRRTKRRPPLGVANLMRAGPRPGVGR